MARGTLSFPFRLNSDGTMATTPHGSDEQANELMAALTLTTVGERLMVPEYGIPDPAFAGISTGDIQVGVDQYGPEGITVTSVEMEPVTETTSRAVIAWERQTNGL